MDHMGIGGWKVAVLLAAAVAVVAMLFVVVRASAASGVRRAQRDTEPKRGDRRD